MNNRGLKITLLALSIVVGAGVVYYRAQKPVAAQEAQSQAVILEYDEARDKQDILKMFVTDRYWLLSSEDYDPEFMLDYKAPNKNPTYVGALTIKVMRENGAFVGFTAFYKKTIIEGMLLFLAVHKDFRGKGNAQKLAQHAIDSLAGMGCRYVTLVTRSENYPAQAVYRKLGFKEIEFDPDGYIYFQKPLA